ncbi:hypothetical protein [[Scytonema hofmanni] UTEX B 1581]|nr:hypothetical protein [[Scytonema hofmanni] UTEX B 1581]
MPNLRSQRAIAQPTQVKMANWSLRRCCVSECSFCSWEIFVE